MNSEARRLYLGIDAGGTKTACALLDRDGELRGRGAGPAANLSHVEPAEFVAAIRTAWEEALEDAGAVPEAVLQAYICLAGFAPRQEEARVRCLVDPLLAPARCSYGRDLDAALAAVCGAGPGLVIIAGTGSVAYGRDAAGRTHRAGGWGYLIGDEGSAYFLGSQALRRTMQAFDGRSSKGRLFERVMHQAGVEDPEILDKMVYRERWRPADIAAYAPLVTAAAGEGDPVALELMHEAARDLAAQAEAVIRSLDLKAGKCGLVGGLWKSGPILREPFESRLRESAPGMELVEPTMTPAEGAGLLALYEDGIIPQGS